MANDNTNQISELNIKRGTLKAQLTRFSNFLNAFGEDSNLMELVTRLDKIEPIIHNFEEIQSQIEVLSGHNQEDEREQFEVVYFNLIATAKQTIHDRQQNTVEDDAASNNSSSSHNNVHLDSSTDLKLPPINLPEFKGSYGEWLTFSDVFTSLVHNNARISEVQKFIYLRSCVKGDAEYLIKSLKTTNANYTIAWEMLRSRYENKKLIVHHHIKTIFDLPLLKEESYFHLRNLLDNFNKNLGALKAMGQETDKWDLLLIYILTSKLDNTSKREWEKTVSEKDFPKLEELLDFISKRSQILETIENKTKPQNYRAREYNKEKTLTHFTTSAKRMTCAFCQENHFNFQCEKISKFSDTFLLSQIMKHKLCENCLRPYHSTQECKTVGCKHCGKKHHYLLHKLKENKFRTRDYPNSKADNTNSENSILQQSNESEPNSKSIQSINLHCTTNKKPYQHLLGTALVYVTNKNGQKIKARALLDSCSMTSLMTSDLAQNLGINATNTEVLIGGINQSQNVAFKHIKTILSSLHKNYQKTESFLIIDKITDNLPFYTFDETELNIPEGIQLADETFNISQPIDILLDANIFYDIIMSGKIKLDKNGPYLQNTRLGWILAGEMFLNTQVESTRQLCHLTITNNNLHEQIEKFWKVEEISTTIKNTQEEKLCEQYFKDSITTDAHGRFKVNLPLKNNYTDLGDSESFAIKRFYGLEKRLQRDRAVKREYTKFMTEYEQLGHMTRIDRDKDDPNLLTFYFPHHGVKKESSTTTKLRVVFDASAKSDSGLSLNDVLMVGPIIQQDLFSIVLRFRKHNIVFTGDIEKMYRQVQITEDHRNLQRIVWRSDPTHNLDHFTLNTITYGTACGSFLAIRSLQETAFCNLDYFPQASTTILRDFYVDDIITGADSINQAIQLKQDITDILKQSNFPLRKFYSNAEEVLVNSDRGEFLEYNISEDKTCKTLGLAWDPKGDNFSYQVDYNYYDNITKRQMLSAISKIFDPLGLLGPITVRAKLFMQKSWEQKLNWDEPLPTDLRESWQTFYLQLKEVNEIKIPRQVTIPNYIKTELHGFSDASQVAYGACIYIISTDQNNKKHSQLLCSKSRIAPLKTVSLPRLELCGALLLVQLVKKCEEAMNMIITKKILWSDSTIVLAWISGEPNMWRTFVANRITQIHELSNKDEWRHVGSTRNPADILSRGTNPRQLQDHPLWWNGPDFITESETCWPPIFKTHLSNIPERSKEVTTVLVNLTFQDMSIFNKYSRLNKLIRVFAYVFRFIHNLKSRTNSFTTELTSKELDNSLHTLVKMIQHNCFRSELKCLQMNKPIAKQSKLYCLTPFLDDLGLMRVGGRLKNSNLSADAKHQLLLPPNHAFTRLLITHEHERNMHCGIQATLAALRLKYWIIHCKNAVKAVIHKCMVCFKAKPVFEMPIMGNLPAARLTPARPFTNVGVDFAGPILIKDGTLRSKKLVKSYICIFVCFATRATHIELAGDLSSECFINVLQRFVSRRGLCQNIYSDNGTNFVGAHSHLKGVIENIKKSIKSTELRDYMLTNLMEWHFIPPKTPHFGGLWEAAVKSAKFHLYRILKETHLTYEGFYTVLCRIEAILNSRPLTQLSSDPNDLLPLTPGHFLIGEQLNAVPERNFCETPSNRLLAYEKMQKLIQHFWQRWSMEYLTSLQPKGKWRENIQNLFQINKLVLLKEDNLPPQKWRLGRIIELHPGRDNVIRVVSVRTNNGVYKRGVDKVSVLPIDVSA